MSATSRENAVKNLARATLSLSNGVAMPALGFGTLIPDPRIHESFDVAPIPDDAMAQLDAIDTRFRFNRVVDTGLPGFIPRDK